MATDVPTYTPTTWVPDAAPGISAAQLQRIDDQVDALTTEFNLHNGGILTTDHPLATGSLDGFMSAAHKAKLDLLDYGGVPDNITPDQTAGAGFGTDVSRVDHRHGLPAANVVNIGTSNAEGGSAEVARSAHVHRIADARAVAVTGGAESGTPTALTGPMTTKLEVAVPRPSGWNTTLVVVTSSSIQYEDADSGATINARMQIDASNGNEEESGSAATSEDLITHPVHAFVSTAATINIRLQAQDNGIDVGTGKYANFTYILIRAS